MISRGALRRAASAALMSALLLWLLPGVAAACTIDNVALLLADGVPAMLTTSAPRATASWAPFTLAQALAAGVPVRLTETSADLERSLPTVVRAAPYRWTFGDGSTALGHVVIHRYARPGLYRLTVSGYDRGTRLWFTFDQAIVRVVPADQVLRANLGYTALQAVITLSGVTWPIDGVLVAGTLVLLVRRSRARDTPHQIAEPPQESVSF